MKKLVILMLLAFGFLSCSKSGDELNLSLANTTWTSSYGSDESVVLEFAEKSVVCFKADKQLNIKGDAQSGTYSYDGEVVKFNLNGKPWDQWTFKEGVVTGNTMFVTYDQYSYNPDTGKYDDFMFEDDRTSRKL